MEEKGPNKKSSLRIEHITDKKDLKNNSKEVPSSIVDSLLSGEISFPNSELTKNTILERLRQEWSLAAKEDRKRIQEEVRNLVLSDNA